MSHDRSRFGLSAPQILGGALAAASAAVASSWLGVAGTVVGAVVVSIVASVGSALYQHSLERSTQVLRETLPPRLLVRAGGAGTTEVLTAVPAEDNEGPAAGAASEPSSPGADKAPIRWWGVAVTAIATLALGLSLVTSLESMLGKPVSSLTGGDDDGTTTLTQLVAPSDEDDVDQPAEPSGTTPSDADTNTDPAPTDADGGTPAPTDDTEPTEPTPTEPSPTEPTPTEPTPTTPTEPTPTEPTGSTPTTSGATTGSGDSATVEAL